MSAAGTNGRLAAPGGQLERRLRQGAFVVTCELGPPRGSDPRRIYEKARLLRGWVDAANLTDGQGAVVRMSPLAASRLCLEAGLEPVMQLGCRDRNRIALQSELMGAAALGIRNLLLLKGDDPKQGDQPDAKPVFDYDTAALTAVAVAMRDKAILPTGKTVSGECDFFIAAADVPNDPKPGWEPASLKAKIAAGCEFVQTQFCMDADIVRRYMARLAEHGVRVPFLIGISPLRSAKSANWMREKLFGTIIPDATVTRLEAAKDPAVEGRKICLDLMRELATIPGVAGVHIMAPGNEAAIADVIKGAAGLKRAK